ncbi:MAG: ABC transporter permease [Ornithinimicrobium sp.]|jgi:ABC-2 type transport system permease protein|uniref:ABC transporter permease n=1 Tax=Ornithinimicrobium sp. TaxID=1977084 RepID=UPI003D9AC323
MSTTTQTESQREHRTGGADEVQPLTRPWAVVAGREIRVKLTDRNFVLSTVFTVVLLAAVFGLQAFLAGQASAPEYQVAVTDEQGSGLVEGVQQTLQEGTPDGTVESVLMDDPAAAQEAAQEGDVDAVLTQADGVWTLGADGSPDVELRRAVTEAVRTQVLQANAATAGTTLTELMAGTEVSTVDYSGRDDDEQLVRVVAGIAFGLLFYMASLLFGLSIAQSVVEEKQSRIVEILTAAIPVRALLTGKVLGNTLLAFGQMVLLVGVGLIGLSLTAYDRFLPMFTEALLWYLPFFLSGFVALACIWAAFGAMASRVEDLQSTTMPLTLLLVAVFLIAINIDGAWKVAGSYVPVMSTIVMPMRLLEGDAAWWEPVLALALTLGFCWLTVRLGARLYRRALLQTQGRVTFAQVLRLGD